MNIFSISDDVLLNIVRDWGNIFTLVHLDTSLCNNIYRHEFLELLKQIGLNLISKTFGLNYIQWISLKGIKLKEIDFLYVHLIAPQHIINSLDLSLTVCLSFTKLGSFQFGACLLIIRSSPNLTCLKLNDFDTFTDIFISEVALSIRSAMNLSELFVSTKSTALTVQAFENLTNECNLLKRLTLWHPRVYNNEARYTPTTFRKLLSQNTSLVYLRFNLFRLPEATELSSLLKIISTHCVMIEECILQTYDFIAISTITNLVLKCTQLKKLIIKIKEQDPPKSHNFCYWRSTKGKGINLSNYYLRQQTQQVLNLFIAIQHFTHIKLSSICKHGNQLDDIMLLQITSLNKQSLTNLVITGGTNITHKSLVVLMSSYANLTALQLYGCDFENNDYVVMCNAPNKLCTLLIGLAKNVFADKT
jgi:hypothetical protein